MECDLKGQSTGTLELTITDGNPIAPLLYIVTTHPYHAGWQTITQTFSKTFIPHEIGIHIRNLAGQATMTMWTLRPDTRGILEDLQQWQTAGIKPIWLQSKPKVLHAPPATRHPITIDFNHDLHMTSVDFPAAIQPGKLIHTWVSLNTQDFKHPIDDEMWLFFHLIAGKKNMYVFQAPLWEFITAAADQSPVSFTVPDSIPPGDYQVIMGLYNSRTQKRLSISGPQLSRKEKQKRMVNIGKTKLTR